MAQLVCQTTCSLHEDINYPIAVLCNLPRKTQKYDVLVDPEPRRGFISWSRMQYGDMVGFWRTGSELQSLRITSILLVDVIFCWAVCGILSAVHDTDFDVASTWYDAITTIVRQDQYFFSELSMQRILLSEDLTSTGLTILQDTQFPVQL